MNTNTLGLIKNLAEKVVTNTLKYHYDICTCPKCKTDIINHITQKISESTVQVDCENEEETKNYYMKEINFSIMKAMDYVSEHLSHIDTENRKKIFAELLRKISFDRGLDLRNYHTEILKRRIALRLQRNNMPSYSKYMEFLSQNPEEYDRLFETLCINVSEFFRDPPAWITIKLLFENLLRDKIKNKQSLIRIWCAGSANGEEPYSLGISLKEALKEIAQTFQIEIIATDIDKACINFAKKAVYAKESLKNIPDNLLTNYFNLTDGKYYVKEEIKKLVSFEYLDLTSQQYLENMDIISCRNVFIYFNRTLQREILDKFYTSLNPKGYLILGMSENLGTEYKQHFEAVDTNARIYRKL